MKREIKFKRYFQNESTGVVSFMYWGCLNYKYESVTDFSSFVTPGSSNKAYPIADCQFTGLKDKNGKEIYEGDIVEFEWYDKMIGSEIVKHFVVFNEGEFRMKPLQSKQETWEIRLSGCNKKSEVISSIHENPELLNT